MLAPASNPGRPGVGGGQVQLRNRQASRIPSSPPTTSAPRGGSVAAAISAISRGRGADCRRPRDLLMRQPFDCNSRVETLQEITAGYAQRS
jgi:hypothetical protein